MRHLFRTLTSALLLIASTVHAGQQPDDKLRPGDGAVLLTVSVDYPTFANANGLPDDWELVHWTNLVAARPDAGQRTGSWPRITSATKRERSPRCSAR